MPRASRYAPLPGLAVSAAALLAAAGALAAPPGVAISQPWIRALVRGMPAAGYFNLTNNSDRQVVLDSASSPGCKQLMLHRSVNTVEAHRSSMKKKLKVQTSAELAKLAFQHCQDS